MLQSSQKYQQYFLQLMVQYICDKQGEVRQAAAYGIGVMAQFGGQGYLQAYTGISACECVLSNFMNELVNVNMSYQHK